MNVERQAFGSKVTEWPHSGVGLHVDSRIKDNILVSKKQTARPRFEQHIPLFRSRSGVVTALTRYGIASAFSLSFLFLEGALSDRDTLDAVHVRRKDKMNRRGRPDRSSDKHHGDSEHAHFRYGTFNGNHARDTGRPDDRSHEADGAQFGHDAAQRTLVHEHWCRCCCWLCFDGRTILLFGSVHPSLLTARSSCGCNVPEAGAQLPMRKSSAGG